MKKTYPLPANCQIRKVTLREINGKDAALAATLAFAGTDDPMAAVNLIGEEKVRLSIVRVDDKEVVQPFLEWDNWNERTRSFVRIGFNELNGIAPGERDGFLAGGTVEP
jgi:hypothetical protein